MVAAQHAAEVLHLTGTLTSLSQSIQSPQLVPAYVSSPCLLTHHAALLVVSICAVSYIQAFVQVALSIGNLFLPLKSNHYSPYETFRFS